MLYVSDGHGCVERIPSEVGFKASQVWLNPDPTLPPRDQTKRRQDVWKHDPSKPYNSPYKESWPYSHNPYFGLISLRFA
jgi:hypothetical protein